MKKGCRLIICALCIIFILGMFSGCGDTGASATATPAPDGGQTGGATNDTQSPYLRPRSGQLKNAIKEGETYRYFTVNTTDSNDPFASELDEGRRDFAINRRNDYQSKYGIKIEYVQGGRDWVVSFAQAAFSGNPLADIFNAGGPFTIYSHYYYNKLAGSILEPLSNYGEYADFSDADWFDLSSQEITTFDGSLYFSVPNIDGFDEISFSQVTFFNKSILAQHGYSDDDMYKMYNDGEWTWDKFEEIAVACTDLDNDTYGIHIGENNFLMWNLTASNNAAILSEVQDADTGKTYYQFSGDSANALEAWDFFLKLGRQNLMFSQCWDFEDVKFREGKVALMTTYVNRANKMVAEGSYPEYGIIMVPKGPRADDYVSSRNWFVPYCVFKNTSNPAGSVQVLSEYCVPRYAASSEENMASFELDATSVSCDEQSVEVLKQLKSKTITEPFIVYWNTPTFDVDGNQLCLANLYLTYNEAFIDGSMTPAVFFASVKDVLNNTLKDAQNVLS